ncbi:MAG: hypothetical protein IJ600_06050 [Lachnospiraceae bacterium]|nr:hypothetical protein [Lachnospiraceae bacterium]
METQDTKRNIIIIFSVILSILVVYTVVFSVLFTNKAREAARAGSRGRLHATASRGRLHGGERGRYADALAAENAKGTEETPADGTRIAAVQNRLVRQPLVTPIGNGQDTVTIMIYMNGSNLETDYGFATDDIREMLKAPYSDRVNIVIETLGTQEWQKFGIANDHTQRWLLQEDDLLLADDSLRQLDCTVPETLSDFITWSAANYPADRYFLILWDHGGGAVDGFGWDQFQNYNAALTIDEMQTALKESGVLFDFIGMDACIMSSIEICYALYDYCDYCILSEDFESALGWSYEGWLTALTENTSLDTVSLATILIDDMVYANQKSHDGDSSTLALIDERYIPSAFESWMNFAYANEAALLTTNFSREVARTGRARPRVSSDLTEYYITDMLAMAVSIDSKLTKGLVSRLAAAVAYYNCTDDNIGLTGLSVTLPYGDNRFYHSLEKVYANVGIDKRYVEWLSKFLVEYDGSEYYDYDEFNESWNGWDNLDELVN